MLIKRAFDVVVAGIGLVVLSPVLLAAALAVLVESGRPVLSASWRVGAGYRRFRLLTFRTVYRDADRRLGDLAPDAVTSDGPAPCPECARLDVEATETDRLVSCSPLFVTDGGDVTCEAACHHHQAGGPAVLDGDPRLTRVGRLLRATGVDELPQLLNVLRGDVALVGGRPLSLYEAGRPASASRRRAAAELTNL